MTDKPVTDVTPEDAETGSDYVCAALAAEGIDTIFGLIGEGNSHLLDRVGASPLSFAYARHEQAAVTMADGYARATGNVGVCTLTHGPGVTNAATGIAAADRDHVPLVILVGDTDRGATETSLQHLDHATFTKPISVAQRRAETMASLPTTLRRAFKTARTHQAPVIVELPGDIQAGTAPATSYDPVKRAPQRVHPDPERVAEAVSVINAAESPVVLAGGGARHAGAATEVEAIAEAIGAPITTTLRAKGLVSESHPLVAGITGTFMTPASDAVVENTDVVIAVGAQLSGKTTRYGELFADADIIQIDINGAALGTHCDPTVGIVGDAATTLEALTDECTPHPERTATVKDTITAADTPAETISNGDTDRVDPRVLVQTLSELLPADTLVTVGSGNLTGFPAVFHSITGDGRLFMNGNFGTMGFAVPAALGVQVAAPDRTVISYTGDGALLQVLGEIETAVRLELPAIIVILNDESYGIIRHRQELEYGRETASSYTSPTFAEVARGCGARAETIHSTDDLTIVEEFLAEEPSVPLVLDVRTSPEISRPGFPPF